MTCPVTDNALLAAALLLMLLGLLPLPQRSWGSELYRETDSWLHTAPATLGMLDGLLPVLVRALRSRHAAVVSLALRCLALLVPLPLPGALKACMHCPASPAQCSSLQHATGRTCRLSTAHAAAVMAMLDSDSTLHWPGSQTREGRAGFIPKLEITACMRRTYAGLPTAAPGAGVAMTELLRRAPDSNAPIAQESFRLLAALLRACASYKVHRR